MGDGNVFISFAQNSRNALQSPISVLPSHTRILRASSASGLDLATPEKFATDLLNSRCSVIAADDVQLLRVQLFERNL